jgi:hypothetical protein
MYRVPPHMAGKNITYQAWVKKEQETHRKNLRSMSSHLIESGAMKPPTRVAVLEANPRKQKLEAERIQAIEAENARLLHRMTKIMDQGPSFSVLHRSKVFISNAVSRKHAATKIAERNLEFCERINKVKPYYDTIKWDEERKVTEHILKGMGLYPYHPPQPKRWQDYFEAEGEQEHATAVEEELDRQWVQSLASFSNRPSQINEELSRSDSMSPKSLRRPKGDNWMLPGLARPGQYSRDSSGRISQTLSDGRMEQLSPDSPSMGTATSAAARSGLRLQPLVKTPTLEAVPRPDAPVVNSRPNSRDAVAPSAGAVDRANLWSSDGTQGTQGKFNAGLQQQQQQQQQQQLEMSLRNDDAEEEVRAGDGAEEERDMDHVPVDESTRQDNMLAAAEEFDSASDSPTASFLNNDSTAATAGSAPEASINASSLSACEVPDAADAGIEAATIENPPHEHASQAELATLEADGVAGEDSAVPLQQHDREQAPDVTDAAVAAATSVAEHDAGVAQGTADDVEAAAAVATRDHDDSSSAVALDDCNVGEGDESSALTVAAAAAGDEVASAVSPTSHDTDSNHTLDSSVQEAFQHAAAAGAEVGSTSNDAQSPRAAIVAGSSAGDRPDGQLSSE